MGKLFAVVSCDQDPITVARFDPPKSEPLGGSTRGNPANQRIIRMVHQTDPAGSCTTAGRVSDKPANNSTPGGADSVTGC
jgi:hypothetical protein